MVLKLVIPTHELLGSYLAALREGDFITMQLGFGDMKPEEIEADPAAYIAKITDHQPFSVMLKNKEYRVFEHELLWITDGLRFLGTLALRYKGDPEILEIYAGNVGLAIRPSLLNMGFGPRAVKEFSQELMSRMKTHGLASIYVTCDPGNSASLRLIEHFGGKLVDEKRDVFGTGGSRRYRVNVR